MNDTEYKEPEPPIMRAFAPKVKDCIVCTYFEAIWEGDGDTDDEEIVYYCGCRGFEDNHGFAKPTKREVCDKFEMNGSEPS